MPHKVELLKVYDLGKVYQVIANVDNRLIRETFDAKSIRKHPNGWDSAKKYLSEKYCVCIEPGEGQPIPSDVPKPEALPIPIHRGPRRLRDRIKVAWLVLRGKR